MLKYYFDVKIITSPFKIIPKFISPSIFFICSNSLNKNITEKIKKNAYFMSNKYFFDYEICLKALKDNNNNINLALNFLRTKNK